MTKIKTKTKTKKQLEYKRAQASTGLLIMKAEPLSSLHNLQAAQLVGNSVLTAQLLQASSPTLFFVYFCNTRRALGESSKFCFPRHVMFY